MMIREREGEKERDLRRKTTPTNVIRISIMMGRGGQGDEEERQEEMEEEEEEEELDATKDEKDLKNELMREGRELEKDGRGRAWKGILVSAKFGL